MAVYRFKVSYEENDDVFRDIEIKSSQTFENFHVIIQDAFKFDAKHAASFFVSDDYWRKNQEITLRKEDLPLDEDEIRKKVEPKKLMAETKIAKYIEQPHQRFVYVFDPNVQWTFLIEMIKITATESPKIVYPFIVKSVGKAPKQYKQLKPKDELNPEMALAGLLMKKDEEDDIEDDEIYKSLHTGEEAVEEDDLNHLEGEEGEEESEDGENLEESEDNEDYGFEERDEEY
ncbi:MAG: hypothetical protein KF900_08875 [Bacteroidetes bacterium]|nr:hypothetical protein [Bacteroidota bacterium]